MSRCQLEGVIGNLAQAEQVDEEEDWLGQDIENTVAVVYVRLGPDNTACVTYKIISESTEMTLPPSQRPQATG